MFAELKVFRQTDALKDYDVPMIAQTNNDLKAKRDKIVSLATDQAAAVADVSVKTYKYFGNKFYYTQKQTQPDPRLVNQVSPKPGPMLASMSGTAVSEALAGADIRNQNLQNQNAMLTAMVGASGCNMGTYRKKYRQESLRITIETTFF